MDPLGMAEQLMLGITNLVGSVTQMWPAPGIMSAVHTVWRYFTSTQALTAGFNFMILVPIMAVLIGLIGLFTTDRGVLLAACFGFASAAMADWANSWGYLYYHLLGFSSVLVFLAALHVYMVEGDISSEILWLYRALDYIGLDGGVYQYSSIRLENRQRRRRARKYQQRPVPPAPTAEEVAAKAAQFRRLQDRCERARILAYPLRPAAAVAAEGDDDNEEEEEEEEAAPEGENNAAAAVAVVLARPPVNANSLSEPDFEPENTEGREARQVDLDKRSARYMLQWLARESQESEGFVVPIKWSQSKRTGEITCDNGYTQMVSAGFYVFIYLCFEIHLCVEILTNTKNRPTPEDFFANGDALIIGSVSVRQPNEIRPALQLINTALDHIKFYDTSAFEVAGQEIDNLQSHSQFRRAVAVNCEFKHYPPEFRNDSALNFDVDNPHWVEDRNGGGNKYVKKDRDLVSLITVSGMSDWLNCPGAALSNK